MITNSPMETTVIQAEARKSLSFNIWIKNDKGAVDISTSEFRLSVAKVDVYGTVTGVIDKLAELVEPGQGFARFQLQASDLDLPAKTYQCVITMTTAGYSAVLLKGDFIVSPNVEFASLGASYPTTGAPQTLEFLLKDQHDVLVDVSRYTPGNPVDQDLTAYLEAAQAYADAGDSAIVAAAEAGKQVTDWNLALTDGFYWGGNPANSPDGTGDYTGWVSRSATRLTQEIGKTDFTDWSRTRTWRRSYDFGTNTWSSWVLSAGGTMVTDWNTVLAPGFYWSNTGAATNSPGSSAYSGFVVPGGPGANRSFQVLTDVVSVITSNLPNTWMRYYNGNAWGAWTQGEGNASNLHVGTVPTARMDDRYRTYKAITDAALAIETGVYALTPSDTGGPTSDYWGIVVDDYGLRSNQHAYKWTNTEHWWRYRNIPGDGSFNNWVLLDRPRTNYTPTFTGLTVGNGTHASQYRVVGGEVHVTLQFTLGSTSAVTGNIVASLPVTRVAGGGGTGRVLKSGGAYHALTVLLSSSNAEIRYHSGSPVTLQPTSATLPFTWGVGDVIYVTFTYSCT